MTDGAPLLIIVNFIPPYDAEMASLLGAPRYTRLRFRYQSKYAPTITRVSSLLNRSGTVALRDRVTGWFMPLRTFRTVSARLVGDVIYLTVEVDETAALAPELQARDSQTTQFNELVLRAIGSYSNEGNTDLLNLILHESGDIYRLLQAWKDASNIDEVTSWGNVVRLIDFHFPGLDLDFFKIVGLRNPAGTYVDISRRDGIYGYPVIPGNEYSLEVLQRTYTGRSGDSSVSSARYVELSALHDDVQLRQDSQPILGKYDILTFWIHVSERATRAPKQTLLSVVRPGYNQRYGVELPLLVRRRRFLLVVRSLLVVLFFVALGAYVAPEAVQKTLQALPIDQLGNRVSKAAIEKSALVLMLLSANASGFTRWLADHTKVG